MAIAVYNTLTRRKETFEPVSESKVGVYVCGVTVYDQSHLGHAKSAINFDVIVRYLRHRGYNVTHVTNFTDVDDKIIARANEMGIEALELSRRMIEDYHKDMDALRIKRADVYPKASESIQDMIDMIKGLIDKGYAYESSGSVYFIVKQAKEYGKLSGQSLDQMVSGARVEPEEDKRDPMDFALWKAAKPGEVSWDSPWGKGRPGWHIECSAMCLRYLGKTVDIHGGGTELIFPHHENEILQSEAYNDAPFVKYWLHNGLLTIDQEKMSKSLKNFFLIKDLLPKYRPEAIRFYILNASYRQPLDYDERSLDEAGKALEKLENAYASALASLETAKGTDDAEGLCADTWKSIEERMDDDFSTREAIAAMFDFAREVNRLVGEATLSRKGAENAVGVFRKFDDIFDVLKGDRAAKASHAVRADESTATQLLDPDIMTRDSLTDEKVNEWVRMRAAARAKKDFAYADKVRDKLAEFGIELSDTKDGAVWKRR